ncbi:hypothetical protein [Thermogemmatispora carboxidivorans]|uniref:hypothetical protein n=1 Tax=Thermogemmatispora carboxidivorans TaxID=1382306 RepID=UPI00069BF13B|nr:hypothetical protein [Thermogemmatispora carboxidivorans]
MLWGDYARLRHDVPALETALEAARKLHGTWLHDGDIKQVQLELALLSTPRAATDLLRLTFDVWYQPREMRSDGSWHWARAGFVVKSLEALILSSYLSQARELATFFAHNSPHSFTVYEALRWEWTAIRLRLFGTLAQRRAFPGQATRAGYLRQAVIAL